MSFNKYHKNYDRIAQVMKYAHYEEGPDVSKSLPYPLTIELKEKYKQHFKHVLTASQQAEFDLAAGENSPFEPIVPTIFRVETSLPWMNIRINPELSTTEALSKIESVFKELVPSAPFNYKFADTEYAAKFAAEERIGKLTRLFAILAILISCLGLFGLASFVAEQRTKEIGVRKVLGASVMNLWQLLSKDFVSLVIISFFTAAPPAYYFMNKWLQNYPYRAEASWWIFAVTACAVLLITLLTVSFQAIKAAIANPVKSLRTE